MSAGGRHELISMQGIRPMGGRVYPAGDAKRGSHWEKESLFFSIRAARLSRSGARSRERFAGLNGGCSAPHGKLKTIFDNSDIFFNLNGRRSESAPSLTLFCVFLIYCYARI